MTDEMHERIKKHLTHKLGDVLQDFDGNIPLSKSGNPFIYVDGYVSKCGDTSCRGCCFGPHSRCSNAYDLCIKHHGTEYRAWIYKESK